MALTLQEKNFAFRARQLAETAINLREDIIRSRAEWDQNDFFNQITDADLLEEPSLSHLTASELSNAVGALDAIVTALGDYATGQSTHLIKLRA